MAAQDVGRLECKGFDERFDGDIIRYFAVEFELEGQEDR